jgi:cytochrome c556
MPKKSNKKPATDDAKADREITNATEQPASVRPGPIALSKLSDSKLRVVCRQIAEDLAKDWRFKIQVITVLFVTSVTVVLAIFAILGMNLKEMLHQERLRFEEQAKASLGEARRGIERQIAEEFKAENVKRTITATAAEESQHLLKQSVEPSITAFERKVGSVTTDIDARFQKFNATVNARQDEIASSLDGLRTELTRLKERNELTALADLAISDGDVEAFRKLESLSSASTKDERERGAFVELFRVYQAYSIFAPSRITPLRLIPEKVNPAKTKEEELDVDDLLGVLPLADALARAKIGLLLTSKVKQGSYATAEVLYEVLKKETRLEAFQHLGNALVKVSGYKDEGDKLDRRDLLKWYAENRERLKNENTDPK